VSTPVKCLPQQLRFEPSLDHFIEETFIPQPLDQIPDLPRGDLHTVGEGSRPAFHATATRYFLSAIQGKK
jgi:hypothetical protein